jgi:hypothetical protein
MSSPPSPSPLFEDVIVLKPELRTAAEEVVVFAEFTQKATNNLFRSGD